MPAAAAVASIAPGSAASASAAVARSTRRLRLSSASSSSAPRRHRRLHRLALGASPPPPARSPSAAATPRLGAAAAPRLELGELRREAVDLGAPAAAAASPSASAAVAPATFVGRVAALAEFCVRELAFDARRRCSASSVPAGVAAASCVDAAAEAFASAILLERLDGLEFELAHERDDQRLLVGLVRRHDDAVEVERRSCGGLALVHLHGNGGAPDG